jgi:phage/plasmid-associated DNA primase
MNTQTIEHLNTISLPMVQFNGRLFVEIQEPYRHYAPLQKEQFDRFIYQTRGAMSRTQMNRLFDYTRHTTKDLSQNEHLIVFGSSVWDTEKLTMRADVAPADCFWHSPYARTIGLKDTTLPFIMNLAGGDQGLYDDIMQSLAPLVMAKKPEGIIWWVCDNSEGIAMLADAIHRLFPNQIASLSIDQLNARRETSKLNDAFGNIVQEIGNGQVGEAGIYKLIANHDDIMMHKYHSQSGLTVRGNVHHIFTATKRPTFSVVNHAVMRRTIVIPFVLPVATNPVSKYSKVSDKVLRQLAAEMLLYAQRIKRQGHQYEWSSTTDARIQTNNHK